jgi:hypothetical protein
MTSQIRRIRDIRKQARVWMLINDIRSVDIQHALNMRSHSLVANTLAGRQNNREVLRYLIGKGCPREYLYLPGNIKKG